MPQRRLHSVPVLKSFSARHRTLTNLPNNLRFYILSFSVLLSIAITSWARLAFVSDQLFYIRTEQIFGFVSLAFVYIALAISPLSIVCKKYSWISAVLFGRRAIGVSAFYFAALHTAVALWGQLGGFAGLAVVPPFFKISFSLGLTMLFILFLMTITSFDKVIERLTLPRWKWLHRFVYLGGILVIAHVWMIGTHLSYQWVRQTAFGLLFILFALESFRLVYSIRKKYTLLADWRMALVAGLCICGACTALLWLMPRLVTNYHSERHTNGPMEVHHQTQGHSD